MPVKIKILRNIGAKDESFPLHLRTPDLKEGATVDLPDADAQLLIERKLAEAEAPVMHAAAFARAPENPDARKAREANEQKQRDESAAIDAAPVEGRGTEKKGVVEPDEKLKTPKGK